MRKRAFSIIFVLIISSVIMPIFPILISTAISSNERHGEISNLNISALTEINTTLVIDDFPGSPTNWTWAKDQGYCTGLGTQSNPYTISELFFNTSSTMWNCLSIINSRKHFVVAACEFKGNSQFAGIKLDNTTNGVIFENMMHPLTGALVEVYNASYNVILNNNASAGSYYGILINSNAGKTKMNLISDNYITHNIVAGIQFLGGASEFNTISDNIIFNNTIGVDLGVLANDNTISGNRIGNSYYIGLYINLMSLNNEIYDNCFTTNNIHAIDDGISNTWDNGAKGNYWDNYTGLDADNNGIGDVPYNITGTAGSRDNFPLMSCPTPPQPTPEIPGYDAFLVLFAGVASIIGIILINNKRKSITKME